MEGPLRLGPKALVPGGLEKEAVNRLSFRHDDHLAARHPDPASGSFPHLLLSAFAPGQAPAQSHGDELAVPCLPDGERDERQWEHRRRGRVPPFNSFMPRVQARVPGGAVDLDYLTAFRIAYLHPVMHPLLATSGHPWP